MKNIDKIESNKNEGSSFGKPREKGSRLVWVDPKDTTYARFDGRWPSTEMKQVLIKKEAPDGNQK